MTVESSTAKSGPYAGAGTVGPFAIGFRFLDNSHLQVVQTLGMVETTLTLNVDYTAVGAGSNGGAVTLTTALPIGETLTIIRNVPITQLTDYVQSDGFPAASHEEALDKLTMVAQQLDAGLSGAIRVPETVSSLPPLPSATARANTALVFDGSGNPTIASALPSGSYQFGVPYEKEFVGTGIADSVYGPLDTSPGLLLNLFVNVGTVDQTAGVSFTWDSGNPLYITSIGTYPEGVSVKVRFTLPVPVGFSDAAIVNYNGALSYVAQTVGGRLTDVGSSPRSFGATGDGVADDTAYIVTALLYSNTLDLSNRTWRITSPINLPSGCNINMRGASIVAACGSNPIFRFLNGNAGLHIVHGGGSVTGTASCFLFAQGTTSTPTNIGQYASQIHIDGLLIASETITTALKFDTVNSVYIRGANFYTPNGIDATSGKNVTVMVSDSILFSATGLAGTFGIKLRSTGGTTYYNEGWSVVNSTVDNYEITYDVADIFVFNVTGGYHGVNGALSATTGYAFKFQAPTNSNLTDTITVGGGAVINGRTTFVASAGGQAYNANIEASWTGVPGTAVSVGNNASAITVRGKFKAGSGTAIALVGAGNNHGLRTDIEVDSTYTNGVVPNGTIGADCEIHAHGPSIGDIVGAGRSNIRFVDVPVHSVGVALLRQAFSATNLGGGATYAVGATISSQALGCARGEVGDIVVHLPFSGANAATQNVQITPPAGMVLASGTGWSAGNLYLGAAAGLLSVRIPYYCTADVSGSVVIANQAGNTLTVPNQAYCGVIRNW